MKNLKIGNLVAGIDFLTIAGPCAVESEAQIMAAAYAVKKAGANMLRGGAFKPRSSCRSFQGLGKIGLQYLREAGNATGLPVVTEVLDTRDVGLVCEYADVLQIGTRNMQNYSLLIEVGRTQRPVLLKRGFYATIEEWLSSAEYIINAGNPNVILCERGIRTIETYTRNTLDLSAVAALKKMTHLPVLVDPSHATGRSELVAPMTMAAVMAGCDGVEIEVHPTPDEALCDASQQLNPRQFQRLMDAVNEMVFVRKDIQSKYLDES